MTKVSFDWTRVFDNYAAAVAGKALPFRITDCGLQTESGRAALDESRSGGEAGASGHPVSAPKPESPTLPEAA